MNRFVASGLILTVLFVVFIGRNHYSNVSVGLMAPIYDALGSIDFVKGRILSMHHSTGNLPNNNAQANVSAPDSFQRKSPLLKRVTVYPGGIIHAIFTAQVEGQHSEVVFTPKVESRYRLEWHCMSYKLTQQWRDAMMDICVSADKPFDQEQFSRAQQLENKAKSYLSDIQKEQRLLSPQPKQHKATCPESNQQENGFLDITDNQITLWNLSTLKREASFDFASHKKIPHWPLNNGAYIYVDNRLHYLSTSQPSPLASKVYLQGANRFYLKGNTIWSNKGAGLASISLCGKHSKIEDQYLLELGSYNQLVDFSLHEDWAFLSTKQLNNRSDFSAIQIVSLKANRAFGFIKLKGNSYGVSGNQRFIYVANGSYGIAVIDLYDPTLPKLIDQIPTQDVAMDVMIKGDHLIVADRLAGLIVFKINNTLLQPIQSLATEQGAVQLNNLNNQYFSVTYRNGNTALMEFKDQKIKRVQLQP